MPQKLNMLNLNDKVKFGKHQVNNETPEQIIWRIVACNHQCIPEYPQNSVTLWTDRIIDRRCADAFEPSNTDNLRRLKGNNRYIYSNLFKWLNSNESAGKWYSPQHEYDYPPDSFESVYNDYAFYAQRAGFLSNFTEKEINSVLPTTFRIVKNIAIDGGGYDDVTAKIFLPSRTEMGVADDNGVAEGAKWPGLGESNDYLIGYDTEQCFNNTLSAAKPPELMWPDRYILRSANSANSPNFAAISSAGEITTSQAYITNGFRPALNLCGDTIVSDAVDEDGCYTVIFNEPPIITASQSGDLGVLSTPLMQVYTISDPDGDPLTITEKLNGQVVRTLNNQQSGTKLTIDLRQLWQTLSIDTTHTATIQVSDGIFTCTKEWTFTRSNAEPIITAASTGDIGKLAVAFKQNYTISDPNEDTLDVTEKLDGQILRSLTAQSNGTKLTFDLTELWDTLSKDVPHTVLIEITDGLLTTTHSWSFRITDPIEQQIISMQSSIRPTSVIIPILPVQVLVTNNANDTVPVWEDASEEYCERKQYSFENDTKDADEWCVVSGK